MTINDYEQQGGFTDELKIVRDIGLLITELTDCIPARPFRQPELDAIQALYAANNILRGEICVTRNLATEQPTNQR